MIIEIENYRGSTIGAVHVVEREEACNEIEVKEVKGDLSLADLDGDYIFDTDEGLMRLQLDKYAKSTIFRTGNLITLRGDTRRIKDLIGEYATYNGIVEAYEKGEYNEVFILITNYLGHIDYGREFGYDKSHEEICYILLENLLNKFDYRLKDDGFINFVNSQRAKIHWNLVHMCHVSEEEINELLDDDSF